MKPPPEAPSNLAQPKRGQIQLMNPVARAVIFAAVVVQFAAAQEEQMPLMDELLPIPSSEFIPPPPPKTVPAMVIEASTARNFQTHQITVLRGDASTLPDIPLPPEPQPFVPTRTIQTTASHLPTAPLRHTSHSATTAVATRRSIK